MEKAAESIIREATRKGACRLARQGSDLRSLARLFFSPQGKEFCADNNFPSARLFRSLDAPEMSAHGIYIDSGRITLRNEENIALVGDTHATLVYEGVERKYTVILMHGATATVRARSHSVIEVVSVGCKVEYDIDNTVVLL